MEETPVLGIRLDEKLAFPGFIYSVYEVKDRVLIVKLDREVSANDLLKGRI